MAGFRRLKWRWKVPIQQGSSAHHRAATHGHSAAPLQPFSCQFPANLQPVLQPTRMPHPSHHRPSANPLRPRQAVRRAIGGLCLLLMTAAGDLAAEEAHVPPTPATPAIGRIPLPARPVAQPKEPKEPKAEAQGKATEAGEPAKAEAGSRGAQLREAIEKANSAQPPASAAAKPGSARAAPPPAQFTFTVPADKKAAPASRAAAHAAEPAPSPSSAKKAEPPATDDEVGRQYIRARAAALGAFAATPQAAAAVGIRPAARGASGQRETIAAKASPAAPPPWGYEGAGGPLSWGQLKPEYATCAAGQRQSPIAIDDSTALQGPAEPLAIEHQPSSGSVVHTGRTLRVDVQGANALTVRGKRYVLERIEFHQPAEERINGKGFAMSAHLLHRAADGQMAMVAVLLEPGTASPLVDQVVTYLPLDVADRVGLPQGGLDIGGLLPQDARYYQFFGSLTAPPCTEDVLWIVFKQPMTVSAAQLKLFGQLFPNNARPLQPLNGRVVRAAQ